MVALAAIFIAAQAAFFVGILVSPDHVFRGFPAAVSFFGCMACGLALAIHAL